MNVIIGIDPHKATHTAVALDGNELELGEVQVRANASQLKRLLAWAAPFEQRTWAVEGAGGCGYLLSQQLVAAGEDVLDVPATLAARVRVLGSGKSNKERPERRPLNCGRRPAGSAPDPGPAVGSRVGAASARQAQQPAVQQPDPDRVPAPRTAGRAAGGRISQQTQGERSRTAPGDDHAGHTDAGREARRRPRAPRGPPPCRRPTRRITQAHRRGSRRIGHIGDRHRRGRTDRRAMVIGYTGDVYRFATRHRYAAYTGTAPIEISSGSRVIHRLSRRGNRQLNHAMHLATLSQIRYPHAPGRVYYDRKIAEGKTSKEAFRALKRRISDAVYRQLLADARR